MEERDLVEEHLSQTLPGVPCLERPREPRVLLRQEYVLRGGRLPLVTVRHRRVQEYVQLQRRDLDARPTLPGPPLRYRPLFRDSCPVLQCRGTLPTRGFRPTIPNLTEGSFKKTTSRLWVLESCTVINPGNYISNSISLQYIHPGLGQNSHRNILLLCLCGLYTLCLLSDTLLPPSSTGCHPVPV